MLSVLSFLIASYPVIERHDSRDNSLMGLPIKVCHSYSYLFRVYLFIFRPASCRITSK
jgi:hypothetical protein